MRAGGESTQHPAENPGDREEDVKLLQQEVEVSADKSVEDSEKIFTQLIRLMEKGRSDVK